jgi:2-polyprenyl-6-methoxyphenol hydroxylase-like FAD-dependent oxidoreductase
MAVAKHDVIIVGAGIAGSALAYALAQGGLDVLLLEKSEIYSDRVRGEAFAHWGVAEAKRLGLLEVLVAAGGHYVSRMVGYDEVAPREVAEAAAAPMAGLVPDVPGLMTLAHPIHCQALHDAATAGGATTRRGVEMIRIEAGTTPQVEYRVGDEAHEARAQLIVGADGRPSSVREAFGVGLEGTRPRNWMGGLLAGGTAAWDRNVWTLGTEGDFLYAIFPLAGDRTRVYGVWPTDQRERFTGQDAARKFLAAFDVECCPHGKAIADGGAAGPMLAFLNNETWTDAPLVEGGVLIGDAAGWTDPIIGCGLSSAYRDARIVAETLLASRDWSPSAFEPYAAERTERLRRLRVTGEIVTGLFCEFGELGRRRRRRFNETQRTDPLMSAHLVANLAGPEAQPPQMFTPEHVAHVLRA